MNKTNCLGLQEYKDPLYVSNINRIMNPRIWTAILCSKSIIIHVIKLTKVSPVVVLWAFKALLLEHWGHLNDRPAVEALTIWQDVQVIEHLEESWARLVNGADHSAASLSQGLEVGNHLQGRGAVQTTAIRQVTALVYSIKVISR